MTGTTGSTHGDQDADEPAGVEPELDCPLSDGPERRHPDGVPVAGASTRNGSITVSGDTLVLVGDVGTDLCLVFRAGGHGVDAVSCIDARRVTFLGSPGLTLLAEVARVRGVGVPLWAGRPVRRPLALSGLDELFDLRNPD